MQGLNADLGANAERVSEAQSEYDQLNKVFTAVNEETETLRASLASVVNPTATAAAATDGFRDSVDDFGGALIRVDTRFLTFHERAVALSGAIRELPPEISSVRDAFDVLAPTALRVTALFDEMNTSLVDTRAEAQAFTQIFRELQTQITSFAADQAIATAEINLVNPAVSDAVDSMMEYVDVMGEVQGEFETTDAISDRLTQSIRDQASAFDELSRSAGQASQGVGSGVFDQFSAQSPGSGALAAGADPYSAAIAIGVEQSQALLRFAGGQIRDENIQTALDTGEGPGGFDTFLGNLDLITEGFGGLEEFGRRQNAINDAINENLRRQQEAENQAITTGVIRGTNAERISNALGVTSIDSISNFVGQLQGDQFIDPAVLTQVYQPFIDGLQRGMESAGDSLQHAIGQGFDETVISSRVDDLAEDTTRFYDLQIEAVRAAAALSGNTAHAATFALIQERDRIINDATNQLRLLDTSEGIGAVQQRQGLIASQQATLRAGGSEREVPVTFDSAGNPIGEAQAELDPAIAQLASFSADATFSDNVEAFRMSINAAGQTIEGINAAIGSFTENVLRPEFERLRSLILDDDGIIDAAEALELRQQGLFTFEDFSAPFLQLGEDAMSGIQATQQALSNYVAESGFSGNVNAFRMSINAAGTTIADVNTAWQGFVVNTLHPEFERLRGLILDDDGVISAAEELQLREQGIFIFEDFAAPFLGVRDAAVMGITTANAALANYVAESGFSDNVNAFRMSINAAGLTVADVNTAWDLFVENTLRPEFERLRSLILDDDGVIDAAEALELRQQGVFIFGDFAAPFLGIRDAAVMGITTAEQALANYIATSGFEKNVRTFRESLNAAGITIEDINAAWALFVENTLRPEFERLRSLVLDDDGIIDAVEELELREQGIFIFEDFSAPFLGIRDAAVTSLTRVQSRSSRRSGGFSQRSGSSAQRTRDAADRAKEAIAASEVALADYVASSGFEANVEAFRTSVSAIINTVEDVNAAWASFVENTLRPEFERIRGLILDDDGIISAAEGLALRRRGVFTFEDFEEPFLGIRDAAVMGIETAHAALANYIDQSGFSDNVEAFRTSLNAAGLTVADVNTAWASFVENTLRPEFERLRGLILDDDGVIDAVEGLALRRAGLFTFDDFEAPFLGIRDAGVMGIETADAALENYIAASGFEGNVEAFKNSISAIGTTITDVNAAWGAFVENTLRPEFERIRGLILDDDGIIDATEALALREAGVFTFEDFEAPFAGIRDAAVTGIENAQVAMASRQTSNARRDDRFNVNQARFNLGGATSEQDFNTLFGVLTTAINAFYDNEEQRINDLGLGIEETMRLIGENDLARRGELRTASNISNTFATERIRNEERVVKAAQDAADKKIAADKRAAEQQIREEMRINAAINDLRDDALEVEARRLEREEDLYARHSDRLMAIEQDRLDAQEDARRDHFRTQEDIIIATARRLFDEPITSSNQLTADQFQQVTQDTGFIERISDFRRGERRSDIDAGIDDTRDIQAAATQLQQGILDTNEMATERLGEIDEKLASIDESLSLDSTFDNVRASVEMGLEPFVENLTEIFDPFVEGITNLAGGALELLETSAAPTALLQNAPLMPEMIVDSVSITAQNVSVTGGGDGAQGNPQQPQGNMVAVFNIDGKEVADAIAVPMGDNLAKRQGTRRTVVSGGRP